MWFWVTIGIVCLTAIAFMARATTSKSSETDSRKPTRSDVERLADKNNLHLVADDVLVVGLDHHVDAANAFIQAANEAGTTGRGLDDLEIRLEREPGNEYDPYAIKVHGVWDRGKKSRHIGYIAKKLAYKIAMDTEDDESLVAVLSSLRQNGDDVDIKFHVLVRE